MLCNSSTGPVVGTSLYTLCLCGAFSCRSRTAPSPSPLPPRLLPCSESRERHRQRQLEEGADPEEAAAGWQGTEAEATELMVYHAAILRNKRLLFTYV